MVNMISVPKNPRPEACAGWRAWAAATLLVAAIQLLYATHFFGRAAIPVHPNGIGTYDALAEALLQGRVDVSRAPDDPRVQAILFDISVHEGRYYLYWGIAPAALLYVPFRALTGRGLPDAGAAFVFLFGAYLWGAFLLRRLHKRHYPRTGARTLFCALAVLGLANLSLYMLKQARVYEVAAAGGIFFFLGGLCLLAHWRLDRESAAGAGCGKLAGASLCFGLCLLTRPTHVPAILALLALAAAHVVLHPGPGRRRWRPLACLAVPAAAGFGLWCAYNALRFGHPLESGQALQDNGLPDRLFHLRAVFRGIYFQLLQPPRLLLQPPFIRGAGLDATARALAFGLPHYTLNNIGIWFLAPFTLILPAALPRALRTWRGANAPAFIGRALALALAATLAVLLCFAPNDLRYPADYFSTALLLSALAWFATLARAGAGRAAWITAALVLAAAASVAVNLVVGFYLY